MKPIMKKWLTGLLCASLLAGSAPAYGADFSAEADFSSEISVEETQEEDQTEPETPSEPEAPAEVDLEQPDDFTVSQVRSGHCGNPGSGCTFR